jgi:RecG-like helicase
MIRGGVAENVYAGLQQYFAPLHYQVGLLHGKLPEEEKQAVMQAFRMDSPYFSCHDGD